MNRRTAAILLCSGKAGAAMPKAKGIKSADKIAVYGRRRIGGLSEGLILLTYAEHML
ncbi:hypothetical protein [Candidatus Electronema sp. TJ]|uniref:hypothetical protein n=1 Tax=Candidatus Electronema sp. TJ TaxID=3401573 RepID=UPI003AA996FC